MRINELYESMGPNEAYTIFSRFGAKDAKNYNADQLKKIYIALVKKNHPDRGGSENAMKDINAAYEILSRIKSGKQEEPKPFFKRSPPKWKGHDLSKEWENFFNKVKEPEKSQTKQKDDAPKKRGDKIDISI